MSKPKSIHVIRTNIGSSEYIINNKIKGLFYYYTNDRNYALIKDGILCKTTYESLSELSNAINEGKIK